jgi:parallel beta-helix repeat protein
MARSVSPLLALVFLFLILNSLVMVVKAPFDPPVVTVQSPDYFIGERVEATMVVDYQGQPSTVPKEVKFEWMDPGGGWIFNKTTNLSKGTGTYLAAFSNWTANMTGTNFTVRGIHIVPADSAEAHFNVSSYDERVVVETVSIITSRPFYENNTVAKATATLGYLGNGTELGNVSFEWRYPNSTLAFTENVPSPGGGLNGTSDVNSFWAVDFVGTGFEVQATYNGVWPLSDFATFEVITERVRTWKNQSVSGIETWAEVDSPFAVCANITVQPGAILTVEAGSIIRFCPDAGLTVQGTLVMDGLLNSKINLTSYLYPSSPGDWKGVTFEQGSDDVGSVLNQVIIEYSQQGLVLNEASPTVANASVANSSVSGIEVHMSTVLFSGLWVIDSGRGIYAVNSELVLMDSEILRCNDGVVMEDSNGTLESNWIHHNTDRGIWLVRSNPSISGNTVLWNTNEGIRIDNSQDVHIVENTISQSNLGLYGYQSTHLNLQDNFISNAGSDGLVFWTSDEVLVENSTIASSPTSIRVVAGSEVTTLNSTFNDSAVSVSGGSRLYVDNFLHVQVTDASGSPLEGASITLTVDGIPRVIGSTGQDGWMKWHIVRYETFFGTLGDPTRPQVSLDVSLDNYNITNSPRQISMAVSHTEDFEGQQVVFPPDGDGADKFMSLILGIVGGIIAAFAVILILLAIRRKKKAGEEEEVLEVDLEDGKAYILTQDGQERGFDTFISELEDGASGLCFTRTYPKSLREKYDLGETKVLWLSRDLDKGGLMPTNLGLITNEMDKFLNKNKDGRRIVLLDGLEYLIAQNGFGKVLKLLNHLKDTIGVHNGTLLIPFDMKSVEEKDAAMLRADLEVV